MVIHFPQLFSHFLTLTCTDHLRMDGTDGSIFAIGDCTATSYAPTAQVASQQGAYLARLLMQMAKKEQIEAKLAQTTTASAQDKEGPEDLEKQMAKLKLRPFHYSHQGSLAYIGSDKAIADLPFLNGNVRFVLSCGAVPAGLTCNRADCDRRSDDVPVLAQCIPQHVVLSAQSFSRRERLDHHQDLRPVSHYSLILGIASDEVIVM